MAGGLITQGVHTGQLYSFGREHGSDTDIPDRDRPHSLREAHPGCGLSHCGGDSGSLAALAAGGGAGESVREEGEGEKGGSHD